MANDRAKDKVAPQAPGWYPDQRDSTALRYWDGAAWTNRRRPRPTWSSGGGDDEPVAERPSSGTGSGGEDPADTEHRPGRRRRWWLLAGVATVAAVGVGVAMQSIKAPSPGPRVLTDVRFVSQANSLCQAALPGLRPPDNGPFGSVVTPAQTADRIEQVAGQIDVLAGRLAALPAADADRIYISGWLAGWQRYTAGGRAYSQWLRQHGFQRPGHILDDASREQHLADNFARANGLNRCSFFAVYQPDPANGI